MKTLKYVLGYLIIIQLALPYLIPFNLVYHYRMDYDLVKDQLYNIDVVLDKISQQIKQEDLQNYAVILGDSIAFSGPGNSNQSIGYYMQQMTIDASNNHPTRVYNLAMPAMQTGDIYTMLLKLDKHHISTENVIINVNYGGFVARQPGPPIVFWLKEDLKSLDQESFNQVVANLRANKYEDQFDLTAEVRDLVWNQVELFRYSAFLKKGLDNYVREVRGLSPLDDALGDARPWFEKEGLAQVLQQAEYQSGFSSKALDMSPENPQIYFLDKIIAHQRHKNTLIFMAAANQALMHDLVIAPGYVSNLGQIDQYFQAQPVQYLNLQGRIDPSLFADHLHLTASGYKELAQILWDNFKVGVKP